MIPTRKQCEKLWDREKIPEELKIHQAAVADLSVKIGKALNQRGFSLRIPLIEAAALLHDIEKGTPHHAAAGADTLTAAGFPEIAPIVKAHMRLPPEKQEEISELTVVFLADKMMIGSKPVSIEKRYSEKLQIYRDQPQVIRNVEKQLEMSLNLEKNIKQILRADNLLNLS